MLVEVSITAADREILGHMAVEQGVTPEVLAATLIGTDGNATGIRQAVHSRLNNTFWAAMHKGEYPAELVAWSAKNAEDLVTAKAAATLEASKAVVA